MRDRNAWPRIRLSDLTQIVWTRILEIYHEVAQPSEHPNKYYSDVNKMKEYYKSLGRAEYRLGSNRLQTPHAKLFIQGTSNEDEVTFRFSGNLLPGDVREAQEDLMTEEFFQKVESYLATINRAPQAP